MTTDLQAQADELERQVRALRTLAADEELPARSVELAELHERATKARGRIARATAELAEVREREGAIRTARAERVRELAASGAPVTALAAHASMSVAAVRAALSNEPEHVEGGDDDGSMGEVATTAAEPDPF